MQYHKQYIRSDDADEFVMMPCCGLGLPIVVQAASALAKSVAEFSYVLDTAFIGDCAVAMEDTLLELALVKLDFLTHL